MYLVTGGFTNGGYLASTELLLEGGLGWEPAAPLPSPRAGLRAASVNNRVIVTGGLRTVSASAIENCHYCQEDTIWWGTTLTTTPSSPSTP